MRKELSSFRLALYALCVLSLFGLRAYGQDKDQKIDHPNGIVQDWSQRHVVYTRFGSIPALIAVQNDPRAILSWQAAEREDWHRFHNFQHFRGAHSTLQRDWSISLGNGSTAPAMYPAKFGFDPTAVPSCPNDYAVYPVNVTGLSFVSATGTVTAFSTTVTALGGEASPRRM